MSTLNLDNIDKTTVTIQDATVNTTAPTLSTETRNSLNETNILASDTSTNMNMNQVIKINSPAEQDMYSTTNINKLQSYEACDTISKPNETDLTEMGKCTASKKDPWRDISTLLTPAKLLNEKNTIQLCPDATEQLDIQAEVNNNNVQQVHVFTCPVCNEEYSSRYEVLMHAIHTYDNREAGDVRNRYLHALLWLNNRETKSTILSDLTKHLPELKITSYDRETIATLPEISHLDSVSSSNDVRKSLTLSPTLPEEKLNSKLNEKISFNPQEEIKQKCSGTNTPTTTSMEEERDKQVDAYINEIIYNGFKNSYNNNNDININTNVNNNNNNNNSNSNSSQDSNELWWKHKEEVRKILVPEAALIPRNNNNNDNTSIKSLHDAILDIQRKYEKMKRRNNELRTLLKKKEENSNVLPMKRAPETKYNETNSNSNNKKVEQSESEYSSSLTSSSSSSSSSSLLSTTSSIQSVSDTPKEAETCTPITPQCRTISRVKYGEYVRAVTGDPQPPSTMRALVTTPEVIKADHLQTLRTLSAYITKSPPSLDEEQMGSLQRVITCIAQRGRRANTEDYEAIRNIPPPTKSSAPYTLLSIFGDPPLVLAYRMPAPELMRTDGAPCWKVLKFSRHHYNFVLRVSQINHEDFIQHVFGCPSDNIQHELLAISGGYSGIKISNGLIFDITMDSGEHINTNTVQPQRMAPMIITPKTPSPQRTPHSPKQTREQTTCETPRSPANPLCSTHKCYDLKGCAPRQITAMWLRRLEDALELRGPHKQLDAWFNLAANLSDTNIPRGTNVDESKEAAAQRLFKAGAYAKAFEILTSDGPKQAPPAMEDIMRLFPRATKPLPPLNMDIMDTCTPLKLGQMEVMTAVMSLEGGKGVGMSGLSAEILKKTWKESSVVRKTVVAMCERLLNNPHEAHPQLWRARLITIPKARGGVRPIVLEETMLKLLSKLAATRLSENICDKLHQAQCCLKAHNSQLGALSKLRRLMTRGFTYMISVDFSNAYGRVDRETVIRTLLSIGTHPRLINFIRTYLSSQTLHFTDNTGKQRELPVECGVLQGNAMSTILFCAGIDGLIRMFETGSTRIVAFADDIILLSRDIVVLNKVWPIFCMEAREVGMEINMEKTKLLLPDLKQLPDIPVLKDLPVMHYNHGDIFTFLGIPISNNATTVDTDLEEKLEMHIDTARRLWTARIPLQTKYHLHQMCIVRKMVYYLRGTHLTMGETTLASLLLEDADKSMLGLLPHTLRKIDPNILTLPHQFGGLSFLKLEDLATICRIDSDIREGRAIPTDFPELEWLNGPETLTLPIIHARYYQNKVVMSNMGNRLATPELWKMRTILLRTPPTSPQQILSDDAFALYIGVLTGSPLPSPLLSPTVTHCPMHTNKECDGAHALCCAHSASPQTINCHNEIVRKIASLVGRGKTRQDVQFETYSAFQRARLEAKLEAKKTDILYTEDGKEHSIDVTVASSLAPGPDHAQVALTRKRRQYNGEPNVHLIVFALDDHAPQETLSFMKTLGAGASDWKDIWGIIFTHAARKVAAAAVVNHQAWSDALARQRRREHYGTRQEPDSLDILDTPPSEASDTPSPDSWPWPSDTP